MDESILNSIKKMLGLVQEDDSFDEDLIMHINSVLGILTQMGMNEGKYFTISGDGETWSEYLTDEEKFGMVKTYIYLKVKKIFDPPNGSVLNSLDAMISEFEWRINVAAESNI